MSVKKYQPVKCYGKVTTNYIYHMLSVARINYDNWYGAAYRQLHPEEDLRILLSIKETFCGQLETCESALYSLIATFPSCLHTMQEVRDYFEMLDFLFNYKDAALTEERYGDVFFKYTSAEGLEPANTLDECLCNYHDYSDVIITIAGIFLRNINTFMEYVWPIEEPILKQYAKRMNKKIASMHLMEKWDGALNNHYFFDHFDVILSRAIIDGPQGVNLSKTKDLFAVTDHPERLLSAISHELGVFSIISTNPVKFFGEYQVYEKPIEGMASYFNNTLYPKLSRDVRGEVEYQRFMEACHKCGQPIDINGWIEASIHAIEGGKKA